MVTLGTDIEAKKFRDFEASEERAAKMRQENLKKQVHQVFDVKNFDNKNKLKLFRQKKRKINKEEMLFKQKRMKNRKEIET